MFSYAIIFTGKDSDCFLNDSFSSSFIIFFDAPHPESRIKLSTLNSQLKSVPLSYAQTGVYFDCLKNPASTLYNVPYCIKFQKDTDTTALAEAIKKLVKVHPQMTVHFENGEEGIVQTVDLEQVVEIPIKQMSDEELAQYKQDFVKPFDLSTGPLYRFEIVITEKHTCLLMDVHHLVFDGGSSDIFLQQLCSIMNGETIEDEDQNYAAYVMTEKAAEGGTEYQAAADFFKERLSEVEAVTEVQSDLLGLDKITQQGLTVINCVANVKHFSAGNDIEMVNIEFVRLLPAHRFAPHPYLDEQHCWH